MRAFLILATFAVALSTSAASADGHAFKLGHMTIGHPYANPTLGQGRNAAAYLTMKSRGDADRLVKVHSDVADRVELHGMIVSDGVMKMRPIEAVEVPAGGGAALAPGGNHVMLIGLRSELKVGDSFPLTLTFETAGSIDVIVKVEKRRRDDAHDHSADGHSHGGHSQGGHSQGGSAE